MDVSDPVARLKAELAASHAQNAALTRLLERQGYQLDRMQDQLEAALRELAVLRHLLGRPPPDEPPPGPPAGPAEGGRGPEAADDRASPERPTRRARENRKKKARFGRSAIPASLERQRDLRAVGACEACGGTRNKTLREETVEFYDYQPAQVVVRQVVRPVCRCQDCQHIGSAPFPDDLAPRLRATPRLIAHFVFEKYGRHLSLYRVDQELARRGATIPEPTRDRWLVWAARQLAVLLDPLRRALFGVGLLHMDGTGLDVIEPRMGTRLGQMSVYCNALATIFAYSATKEGKHQRQFLGLEGDDGRPLPHGALRYTGYLVADAANNADRTMKAEGIVECGCVAHARRKFEEAEPTHRRLSGEAIAFFTALYALDAEATRCRLDPRARLDLRRARSAPIVADFRRWLDGQRGQHTPKDPLGQAVNYTHNHWAALTRFLDDGRVPLDNNLAERRLRAIAVGRKNYLFAGSDAAAARSALFYTFVTTALQHGLDPEAWLADVLPRIAGARPAQYPDLLPTTWKPAVTQKRAA